MYQGDHSQLSGNVGNLTKSQGNVTGEKSCQGKQLIANFTFSSIIRDVYYTVRYDVGYWNLARSIAKIWEMLGNFEVPVKPVVVSLCLVACIPC